MRRRIAVLAVALLTVTAGCTTLGGPAPLAGSSQTQNQMPHGPSGSGQTVAVSASGHIQTTPNKAVIRVAVTARADSVETVRQQLAQNASQMRTALEDAGLAADQIVSARYDIGRNHERDERPGAATYRGQHSFVITLNETDRAGEVVVTAVENGATRVEEVRFTITQETRRDLRRQALANAVENARGKASVMANGTGLTITGVHIVRTADVSVEPIREQDVELAATGDAGGGEVATSFGGGKVTVAAQVTVVYNATST